jgi:hypothetical protein
LRLASVDTGLGMITLRGFDRNEHPCGESHLLQGRRALEDEVVTVQGLDDENGVARANWLGAHETSRDR